MPVLAARRQPLRYLIASPHRLQELIEYVKEGSKRERITHLIGPPTRSKG